ncbi:hypothetical protein PFICI_14128 [Pestalotiopsis fici W106-1]|uniref:Uncharacterized protein n=1 Tax=Pestalotiopsis fici (strain W106-1 / CGMCC3.15140) TaxID=1229662 RepID=W3WM97_PESFW|nr:uncharacterized protein PFICI_14128 [Pestalotiopsis fici W106-1]ETS74262.1 hypothetical protein PFICI_14128 [Pestalotiopsis fici W106-1]
MRWFEKPEHPNAGCVLDRYVSWSDGSQPLWWSAAAYGNAAPFICTTAQRLINRAIRLALEENGYDRYGRAIAVAGPRPQKHDLYGTLRILCTSPKVLCQLKFSTDILDIGRSIVTAALPHLAIVQNGKPASVAKLAPKDSLAMKQAFYRISFSSLNQSSNYKQDSKGGNFATKRRAQASSRKSTFR